ncbi:HAD-IIB family hydrolase [Lacrimispora sp.]|jgi:HAD superfamily hydrolase (TIGR01484 family)|uniref:HAD-IIB family hydrolase n=1 Tax=Lacrimispora sp. TaxID=2719234 RepID=UPI0028AD57F8|nr:HAD-IIB family hydrolase [Lacrimispora sp.]
MIRLVAMDLDGTLTQHKSRPDAECLKVLDDLAKKYRLLIVGAGGCERIFKQLGEFSHEIIGFYGMQRATSDGKNLAIAQRETVVVDNASVIKRIEQLRVELGYTDFLGETVEFHDSGLITFPLLGTAAHLDDKLAFDPDRTKRRAVYARVKEVFNEFTVFIGGSSSFDIAPKPYCKSYALQNYIEKHGIRCEEVVYFGDDYGMGGNDEDIYNSDIRFVCIDDYREFPEIARSVLL